MRFKIAAGNICGVMAHESAKGDGFNFVVKILVCGF